MSELPTHVTSSLMWRRLSAEPRLRTVTEEVRRLAESLGEVIRQVLPGFTDHSIRHMDALWRVADQVFTEEQSNDWTPAEAFVLGCTFYVHDLAMCLAATPEGASRLRATSDYRAAESRLSTLGVKEERRDVLALEQAARAQHAKRALDLTTAPLPGLEGRYLIEATDVREHWGHMIGSVASSHHWPMSAIEREFGPAGRLLAPAGGELDLATVACALRVIDYAHINNERALFVEQCLRSDIPPDSTVHWAAQRDITGPKRADDTLKYNSLRPISVEAWWQFFEMARGLHDEIRAVRAYLDIRSISRGRFTLHGVAGTTSPTEFAELIRPADFEPIDVRVRPHSISRLVDLLGGRSLYGDDVTVCVRELLQNAADAIHLRRSTLGESDATFHGQILVSMSGDAVSPQLVVRDDGVGMSVEVLTNHLLGIASDYWKSDLFAHDYPSASKSFRPVGRFGVGFLSVFMIAERVEVETERRGGERLALRIENVGRRGALRREAQTGQFGTTIRIFLKDSVRSAFDNLAGVVRRHAPMLDIPVVVRSGTSEVRLDAGWWRTVPMNELLQRSGARRDSHLPKIRRHSEESEEQPIIAEHTSDSYRVGAVAASPFVLLCSRGFAVTGVPVEGLRGIVDVGDVDLDTARARVLEWDVDAFRKRALELLWPQLIAVVDGYCSRTSIPGTFGELDALASTFGTAILKESQLPWIAIVEPPGTCLLVASDALRTRLATLNSVFVAFDTGPWSVHLRFTKRHPEADPRTLLLPIASDGGVLTSYEDPNEIEYGLLREQLRSFHKRDGLRTGSAIGNALLEVIAEAWEIDIAALAQQRWSRSRRLGELSALLSRPGRAANTSA